MKIHLLTFSQLNNPETSSFRNIELIKEAAQKRDVDLRVIQARECKLKFNGSPRVLVNGKTPRINTLINQPNFLGETMVHASLIRQFELMGVKAVNKASGISLAKNKIAMLQALNTCGVSMPTTYVLRSSEYSEQIAAKIGSFPLILKSVTGSHGIGVSIIESARGLRSIVDMLVDREVSEPIILQEYIRESRGKDIRVIIVGGKVVAAMERIARRRGEFRSNFELGGKVRITELTQKEKNMAIKATKAFGLDFSGVDILRTKNGPKILELNSNPGLSGITQATGKDIAGTIVDLAIKKYKGKK